MAVLVDSVAEPTTDPLAGDRLKLVRFVAPHYEAARPTVLADLTTTERHIAQGGSPQLVPGERDRGNIRLDVPWAGEFPTLDRHGNARLSFTLRLMASDPVADADAIVAAILTAPSRCAIEWRRGGRPTYFPLRGDADWTPSYSMRERRQGGGMTVAFNIEVAPWSHRGSMDIADAFAVDSLADYTFDAGAGTLSVSGGQLVPADTAEKRFYHSARGFSYADVQATLKVVSTAVNGATTSLVLRRLAPTTYLVARVVGEAGSQALEIHRVDDGVFTQLARLVTAIGVGGTFWLRARLEGLVMTAELFTAEPTPMGAPGASTSANVDAKFSSGGVGVRLVSVPITWRLDDFRVQSHTYRNRTLPQSIALGGPVPGDLPALCDLVVTPSGGTSAPIAGLFGWAKRPPTPTWGRAPLGVIEAESGTILSGFVVASSGAALGGQFLSATAIGPSSASVQWEVDSGLLIPDEDGTVSVEVFARIGYDASYTGLKWVLWANPRSGTDYGARRYSDRGTAGLVPPAATALTRRFVRLGRIRLGGQQMLGLDVTWTTGSNGIVLDYILAVPSRSFVASPMGVALDSAFPRFAPSTAETVRTLLHDGGSTIAHPTTTQAPLREHGLGRRIELPVGDVDLVTKLSSLVIDRPEADGAVEQLTHAATVRASLLPRFAFA